MAFPDTLLLPASALAKVDDENYRALVIDKAQLPHPDNQNGSKRLIVESMASVGINADLHLLHQVWQSLLLHRLITVALGSQTVHTRLCRILYQNLMKR